MILAMMIVAITYTDWSCRTMAVERTLTGHCYASVEAHCPDSAEPCIARDTPPPIPPCWYGDGLPAQHDKEPVN